ncbi:MAG: hypothetical protein JWQ76_2555 [Ramlibacter sp.]|nr:hypothetical protein [Ramlibacter sp.]
MTFPLTPLWSWRAWIKRRDWRMPRARPQRSAAPTLELVRGADHDTTFAFGLQWRTIATRGGRADAIQLARAAGASHFVFRGNQLGMGVLPPGAGASSRVVPAILVTARQHVGTAIVALALGPGEYWIAASVNGQPTSADHFLQQADEGAAIAWVRELQSRFAAAGEVGVRSNIPALVDAQPLSSHDLLALPVSAADLLQPLPRPGAALPRPVLGFLALALVLLLAQHGWNSWQARSAAARAAQSRGTEADPAQAWAATLAAWEAATAAPDGLGLAAVRDSLSPLPLAWDGWRLASASCLAGPLGAAPAATRGWNCKASYLRGRRGSFNRDMGTVLPAGWSVSFLPLGGMELRWSVQQPVHALHAQGLRSARYFEVEVASRLQRLLPALAADLSFAFTPVELAAPRRSDGTALPADARAESLRQARLVVAGPLRSIDALIASDIEAEWLQLSIQFDATEPRAGAKTSALMAEAKGNAYARK